MLPLGIEETALAAAGAGFTHLGIRTVSARAGAPVHLPPGDLPRIRRLVSLLDSLGLSVLDVEVIGLFPDTKPRNHLQALETAALLGARHMVVLGYDPHLGRAAANLSAIASLGRQFGLRLMLEFVPYSSIRTLREALALLEASGASGGGLLLDPLHLARSGGLVSDLEGLPSNLLPYCQLCDAPAESPSTPEGMLVESSSHRLLPGAGELPLRDFVAALPSSIGISLEVQGLDGSAESRARRGMSALRSQLQSIQPTDQSVI
jgi:sugar phosphate isomerase/epimerase